LPGTVEGLEDQMTLRELNHCLKESESEMETSPSDRLFAAIKIIRSILQKEIATDEGAFHGMLKFKEVYGEFTSDNVDRFMDLHTDVLDTPIPNDFIWQVLESD
jgi:hypothetical protein